MTGILRVLQHSALRPASVEAARIERLTWVLTAIAAVVAIAVIATALVAAFRRRAVDEDPRSPAREATLRRLIIAATVASVVLAFITLGFDFAAGRDLHHGADGQTLSIRVTGHQWWWDVEYEDSVPQKRAHTANEIHVPLGRPVVLKLSSFDVIHSFWAPSLGGKRDLIPGHPSELSFQATRAGRYRTQCAEYCGLQHANMALDVVVESEAQFAAWLAKQRDPAPVPTDPVVAHGRDLLERSTCASCHNVTGTLASGSVGPDLTHVGSRLSLAAGTLPNDSASLVSWIANPHRSKPGVLMPSHDLSASDLAALAAFLAGLR
jgi:cytochrome c oxidase subunit 2